MTRRSYFVVHRGSEQTRVLARLDHVVAHRQLLDPFRSQLVHAGDGGVLLLVDAATREFVLRQPIDAAPRRYDGGRSLFRVVAPVAADRDD